jgi:hypothetical protein
MVLEYNSQKPFPQQNGFGVQLTETISTTKWLMCWDLCTVHKDFTKYCIYGAIAVSKSSHMEYLLVRAAIFISLFPYFYHLSFSFANDLSIERVNHQNKL